MKKDIVIDRQILKSTLKAGPECLSASELDKLVAPGSTNVHLSLCAHCQAELAMLRAFQTSAPLADEGAAVAWISAQLERNLEEIKSDIGPQPKSLAGSTVRNWLRQILVPRNLSWALAGTAMAVVLIVTFLWMRPVREPELRADAGAGPAVYRSLDVQLIGPLSVVSKMPRTLQWKPVEGAAQYKITLMEIDEIPFIEMKTNDVFLTIPLAAVDKLQSGRPLLWRVTALDQQSHVLALSQIARFSLSPDQPN